MNERNYYTSERNAQMLIALMKHHKVRKVIASPGTTNLCLVGSLQQDSYFEMYSCADERSAAYIACGLAQESGGTGCTYVYRGNCLAQLSAKAHRSIL